MIRQNWTIDEIRRLRAGDLINPMTEEEFRYIGEQLDAFWQYPGDPGAHKYHALLASGLHSNGFVNVSTVLAETNVCEILVSQMIHKYGLDCLNIGAVVGPGNAAITLSYEVARQLRARHLFTEKDDTGKPTKIGGRARIRPGERVLIVNELMTTGSGSTLQCKQGVLQHQPEAVVLPFVVVLIKRSTDERLADGTQVEAMFSYDIANWTPEECPYCLAGSEAIKPKTPPENWQRLTGRF